MKTNEKYTLEEFMAAVYNNELWAQNKNNDAWFKSSYDKHDSVGSVLRLYDSEQVSYHIGETPPEPEVKALFPKSYEEGARFFVNLYGVICEVSLEQTSLIKKLSEIGRTFYTREDAKVFSRQEGAKAYCLSAIHKANKGKEVVFNADFRYKIMYDHEDCKFIVCMQCYLQSNPVNEYFLKECEAVRLIKDSGFIANWKRWKGLTK